jgi:hypothetical protein
MPRYCKAYKLTDVRKFEEWSTQAAPGESELPDDELCFVHEDFTVTRSCFADKDPLLRSVTPEWRDFCAAALGFEVPADIRAAQEAFRLATEREANSARPDARTRT